MDIQSIYPACLGFILSISIVAIWLKIDKIKVWFSSVEARVILASALILLSPFIAQISFTRFTQASSNQLISLKDFASYISPFVTFFLGRYGVSLESSRKKLKIRQGLKQELCANLKAIQDVLVAAGNQEIKHSDLASYRLSDLGFSIKNGFWFNSYYQSLTTDQIVEVVERLTIFEELKKCHEQGEELQTSMQVKLNSEVNTRDRISEQKDTNSSYIYGALRALSSETQKVIKLIDSVQL